MIALFAAAPANGQAATADSGLVIEINVPAFRLDALLDTTVLRSFKVAIGMPRYPTPTGEFAITEVEWNPWWHPPESEWASKDTVTPPGPQNPMGRVKMSLGSTVRVHGTPVPSSIGTAASHACIRMKNGDAIALARIVQSYGGVTLTDAGIDSILGENTSRRVVLRESVPVRIVYRLVELRGEELRFYPDVYRRGRDSVQVDAIRLLIEAGHDSSGIDRALLSRVVREGARSTTRVRIALLVPG